jgi:hypothetical protein
MRFALFFLAAFSFLAQNLGVVRRMRREVLDEGKNKLPFWSKNVWVNARKRHGHHSVSGLPVIQEQSRTCSPTSVNTSVREYSALTMPSPALVRDHE